MAANDDDVGIEALRGPHYHVDGRAGRHVKAWSNRRSCRGDIGYKACELCFCITDEIESGMTCTFRQEWLLRVKHMERGTRLPGKSACEQKCSARRI